MNIKTILPALALTAALASCSEGSNEYHTTYFYPVDAHSLQTYADQTYDTIHVVSYDSWTLNNRDTDWLTIKEGTQQDHISVTIPEGFMANSLLQFYLQPNTTGKVRSSVIEVVSSYSNIGSISAVLVQYPYLNITRPVPTTDKDGNTTFVLKLRATDTEANVTFTTYNTNTYFNAAADSPWLQPEMTSGFLTGRENTVKVTVSPNTATTERTGTLTLTSNNITTNIQVIQAAAQ